MSGASGRSVSGRLLAVMLYIMQYNVGSGLRGLGIVVVVPCLRGTVAAPPGLKRPAGGERAPLTWYYIRVPPTMLERLISSEYC